MANSSILGGMTSKPPEQFYTNLPARPYCTNDFETYGLQIRPKRTAITRRYLQPQFPKLIRYMLFDVDREEAGASWYDLDLARPTIVIVNPQNGHAHLVYELLIPIGTFSDEKSRRIMAFFNAIRLAYAERLRADLGYNSLIIKNPVHRHWYTITAVDFVYTLGELAEYVELETRHFTVKRGIREDYAQLGRNCRLFEHGRIYSYDIVYALNAEGQLYALVYTHLQQHNAAFDEPLEEREVQGITQSITGWTWQRRDSFKNRSGRHRRKTTDEELTQIRRTNALNTHEVRKAATEAKIKQVIDTFLREGRKMTKSAIAREAGVSRQTLDRYRHLLP